MAAVNIQAEAQAWAEDEISRRCMGERFGAVVVCSLVPVPTQQGPVMLPMWSVLITAGNPQVGTGPLWHVAAIGDQEPQKIELGVEPSEADVRKAVTQGVAKLRLAAASKLAVGNGGKKLPPGLAQPGR
jgi:hypothetical protein